MIIEEVCVQNFGVYRGQHKLRLEPVSKKRPVVIIGALNGSGKTTLLDAMQLALYGKIGTYSSRGEGGYDDFLRRAINHKALGHEGASVELAFRQAREGVEQQYRAKRAWRVVDGKVRETFEILRDGAIDPLLSEHWYEYVEELLPARIAPLFFFDGEKVVELADVRQAPALLRVAIQSLLGLDIVQQLKVDLGVLARRKRAEVATDKERANLANVQRELDELEARYEAAHQEYASCNGAVEQAQLKLEHAQRAFRDNGGVLFEQQSELERERAELEGQRSKVEDDLRDLAAGELPLLLLRDQIEEIARADSVERELRAGLALVAVLESRDDWLIKLAKKEKASGAFVESIKRALAEDRKKRKVAVQANVTFELSDEARRAMEALRLDGFSEREKMTLQVLREYEQKSVAIGDVERKLAAVPDEESLRTYVEAVKVAQGRMLDARNRAVEAKRQLGEIEYQRDIIRKELAKSLEAEVERHNADSDAARVLSFSSRAADSLTRFEGAVIRHHIRRLEDYVLQSLQTLLRKDQLISKVAIDPESFSLTLTDRDGQPFSMERLSAGERQLLAVSLLWGLAKASGRPMPTIIDTPLGRLDSEHRSHLVDRYFPRASHQVILLSTDMEIDATYYRKLQPAVSHSYTLTFDSTRGSTQITDGLPFAEGGFA